MSFCNSSPKRRKITGNNQDSFEQLFSIKDLFQSIVMGGFISLPEAIRMSLVCKDWHDMINCSESFNMFTMSFIQSSGKHLSKLSISNSTTNGDDFLYTIDHVKTIYEMIRGWSCVRSCQRNDSFSFNGNSYPYIGDEHIASAQQFFTPHLIDGNLTIVMDDFPVRKGAIFGLFLNVGMENEEVNFEKIYWIQKEMSYMNGEYLFLPIIKISRKKGRYYWKDIYMTPTAEWKSETELIRNVTKNGETVVMNKEFNYIFNSSDMYGSLEHQVLKNIRKCSTFHLAPLPDDISDGDLDENENIFLQKNRCVLQSLSIEVNRRRLIQCHDEFFNLSLKKVLYRYLTMNLLNIPICREFIFTLLIYLSKYFRYAHRLSFYHDSQVEGSSSLIHLGADGKAVLDWLREYKTREAQNYDEIFHTIVRIDLDYYGAIEGEEIRTNLYVLALKKDEENQICNFEFVDYHYYKYKIVGDILSE